MCRTTAGVFPCRIQSLSSRHDTVQSEAVQEELHLSHPSHRDVVKRHDVVTHGGDPLKRHKHVMIYIRDYVRLHTRQKFFFFKRNIMADYFQLSDFMACGQGLWLCLELVLVLGLVKC